MRNAILSVLLLPALPAVAQNRATHTASGASFPRAFETQSLVEQHDLGTPNDSVLDYEAASGLESTTIYIFKAAAPNARLWFERALPVVLSQIPGNIFEGGKVEKIAAFRTPAPAALRLIFTTEKAGPFKSTALVVAQSGPWIVKMRASSATLDRAGLAARIDRHLATIQLPPPAFAAGLDAPAPCAEPPTFGSGSAVSGGVAQAAAAAVVAHAMVHGAGNGLCLADRANMRFTLLGIDGEPSAWLMLTGDAGKAIGVQPVAAPQGAARQLVYVATPASTRGAALFDAPPTLAAAAASAAPLLRDPAAGLVAITTSASDPVAAAAD